MNYSEEDLTAFKIVDEVLLRLSKNEHIFFNEPDKSDEYKLAIKYLEDYKLIRYVNPVNKESLIDITENGVDILKKGGLLNYFNAINNAVKRDDLVDKLEFEKIMAEIRRDQSIKYLLKLILIGVTLILIFTIYRWVVGK